ncbi:putative tryptophanyl-tRNA synthetase [Paratrimastix pyriformis]|uniref:Tryptophanyl-tRNA synthetase n=1 Tax=Paratrimastix pyriformis TaxID=342808 RepID=A0ABQ8UFU8_9EUKA|nr:putative tryptophanyl-tRNA synthetase [Paratrimastix pyriformis]
MALLALNECPLVARGLVSEVGLADFLSARAEGRPHFLLLCWDLTPAPTVNHLVKLQLIKFLQQHLGCPVMVQMVDDLAYLLDKSLTIKTARALAADNLRHILAELDPARTFAFLNSENVQRFYLNTIKMGKVIPLTESAAAGIPNIGIPTATYAVRAACAISFPGVIEAPAQCLIVCTKEEEPLYAVTRSAYRTPTAFGKLLGTEACMPPVPALLMVEPPCSLQSRQVRIDDAPADTNLLIADPLPRVTKCINKYCFSGGRDTLQEQQQRGANVEVDVGARYLHYFYPADGAAPRTLRQVLGAYGTDVDTTVTEHMSTGEFKKLVIEHVWGAIDRHQQAMAALTPEAIQAALRAPSMPFVPVRH